MIKKLLKFFVLGLLALVIVGLFLPRKANVEVSLVIDRPANFIFQFVDGWSRYNEWSPFVAQDANMRFTFSGPTQGIGAKMNWESKVLGKGSQTVIEAAENEKIVAELDLDGNLGTTSYLLNAQGYATKVSWRYETDAGMNPLKRWFNLLIPAFVKPDYQQGLQNLKARVEKFPRADFANFNVELAEVTARKVLTLPASAGRDAFKLADGYRAAFTELAAEVERKGGTIVGAPIVLDVSASDQLSSFKAALPIQTEIKADPPFVYQELPAGYVLYVLHKGAYQSLPDAAELMRAFAQVYNYDAVGDVVLNFKDDPTEVDADLARTELMLHVNPPNSEGRTQPEK